MKGTVITIFLLLIFTIGQAQTTTTPPPPSVNLQNGSDSLFQLPILDSLIAWAVHNSPLLKEQDAEIQKSSDDADRVKKIWLDAIKISSNVQNGSYGNSIVNQAVLGYQYGTSISFSIYQMLSYKNNVRVYKDQIAIDAYKHEELVQELKLAIINLYNNINSSKNLVVIRGEAYYASYTQMQMADKEFKKGTIEVGELSRVTEIYTKAHTDLESTINDLRNQYANLEILVGRKLTAK